MSLLLLSNFIGRWRVSCSSGGPGTDGDPPASAFPMLGLKTNATISSSQLIFETEFLTEPEVLHFR